MTDSKTPDSGGAASGDLVSLGEPHSADLATDASKVIINTLHLAHPRIRAEDWRSPLIYRLLRARGYRDGVANLEDSYRSADNVVRDQQLTMTWSDLQVDFDRCINTYQEPTLTEFASLAIACVLVERRAKMQITEVTRRGEKVDYWIGDRDLLLEVSGQASGSIDALCEAKASLQLLKNPFGKDGYVCVAEYATPSARLWFYASGVAP